MSNFELRPNQPAYATPQQIQPVYDYYSRSKMAEQPPQQPHHSHWDRVPADIQNAPPIYQGQVYENRPAQPVYMVNDGKGGGQREVVYVQQQQVERKHNDFALGCCAGCATACCCCGCTVM